MEYNNLRNKIGKFYSGGKIPKYQNPAEPIMKDIDRLSRIGQLAADYKLSSELAAELVDDDEAYDNFMKERAFGQQNGFNDLNERLDLSLLITEQNPVSETERLEAERRASSGAKGDHKSKTSANVPWGAIGGIGLAALGAVDNALVGDKNFGTQSQAIDSAVHGVSGALMSSGNPYAMAAGAALEGVNILTKAGGQTVQGYDVNIENSGFGNLGHQESSSSRSFLFGLGDITGKKMQAKLARRNEQARMALQAAEISEDVKFEQEARMNSVDNVLRNNQIALAGGIDTSLLGN